MVFLKTLSLAIVLLALMELCTCIAVYEPNGDDSKLTTPSNNGIYRTRQYNNDDALYRFGYKVNAIDTGDTKHHFETRVKNEVKGSYVVTEPNGASRIVQYTADSKGFNAVVRSQYGTLFSRASDRNYSTSTIPNHQNHPKLYTNIRNEVFQPNNTKLSQQQHIAFDRFLLARQFKQQSKQFRQSSPTSVTNQNAVGLLTTSSVDNVLEILSTSTQIPIKQLAVRRQQQYEVTDPEVDIDIRRSIPKIFLNLEKLKQSRTE